MRRSNISKAEQIRKMVSALHPDDLLLGCMVFLCSHFGRAQSAESIKAGLAYDEKGMSPVLFCEAADRLGMNAKIVKKHKIADIAGSFLPCVIFLEGGNPCVLIEKLSGTGLLFVPETGAVKEVSFNELQRDFTGYAIFVHPRSEFTHTQKPAENGISGHWFWGLVQSNRQTYFLVLMASLFINIFALVSPLFVMNVYDRVIPNNAIETGWVLAVGALVAFTFDFIFRTLRGYLVDFAGRRIDVLAARRIYDHLLDMRLAQRPPSSGAFANMLRDFDAVREFFTSATITALVDFPFALVFLFFVYQLGGAMVFIPIALTAVVCAAGYLIQFALKSSVRSSIKSSETKHGFLVETIHGLEAIKSINAEGRFRTRYGHYVAENAQYAENSRFLSGLGVNIATFFQQILSILMILAGMYMVQDGMLTMGGLIACVIMGGRAIAPLGQIANLMTRYHQAAGALKTLNRIMEQDVERPAGKQFLHRPDLSGKITFDKISFAYPNTQNVVLDGVSFSIRAGERVGIIGRIGSGKSTVARLMMNLYEPQSGSILADDTDYRQIDPADLRRSMAYIAQDVVLFSGTVRDNITAGFPHASEDMILRCAKAAGVHEFIARHPMGYDAPVGEYGFGLSGGQRQAIALARAMIGNPNILVCDEPTNAMDMQAEKMFCDFVRGQITGKTFILITHKNTMLDMVDRLILLHNGKLVMDGARNDVLAALDSGNVKVVAGGKG